MRRAFLITIVVMVRLTPGLALRWCIARVTFSLSHLWPEELCLLDVGLHSRLLHMIRIFFVVVRLLD